MTCTNTKNFTVTSGDGLKTIYAFTKDLAGNISSSSNVTMTLDTTNPVAPVANLASAAISSSSAIAFTVTDCTDRPFIFISESIVAPLATDSGWQNCNTSAGAMTYTLLGPIIQDTHSLYVYAKDATGNVSLSTPASMIYDTTNPTVSLNAIAGTHKGGSSVTLNFFASDTNGLSSLKLEYAADGTNFSLITNLATNATSYNWTVPSDDTTTAKIRLVANDNATAANSNIALSSAVTIDSTAPLAPLLSKTSNAISSSNSVTMSIGSCLNTSTILIKETSSTPLSTDSGWQACSTSAGNYSATVTGDATHTFYAWAKDAVGNISPVSNTVSMILDTTQPSITLATALSAKGNSSTGSISWTLTEANVSASSQFSVELFDGTSWTNLSSVNSTAGNNSNQSYSLSNFNVPNVNVTSAKLRVSLTDAASNFTSVQSNTFTIDSTAPTMASITLNDGAAYAGTASISVKLNVSDNYSTGTQLKVRLSMANSTTEDCQSEYANNDWSTWTNATTIFPFDLNPIDGNKKICAWVKDEAGNVSVISPSDGIVGTNTSSIIYSTGNPPLITALTAVNANDGGRSALQNDPITINWTATDVEGLSTNPVSFAYTTDNTIWKDLTTNLTIENPANITWGGNLASNLTGATGTINWTAPSSSYFRIRAQVKDMAGNTSVVSMAQPFNTGNWNIYAGSKHRGDGGIGRNASMLASGYYSHFAINPLNGDIYSIDSGTGIRKLDAKTGIVSTYIPHGTFNLIPNANLPVNPRVDVDIYLNLTFDSKGRLYIGQIENQYSSKIYQIDVATSYVRLYAGGGLNNDGGSAANTLYIASGGYNFDESDSLYVWTYCGGVVLDGNNYTLAGKRIVKITQNADGSAGTTTRIMGDCNFASLASGSLAYNQSTQAGNYINIYSSIIPWDNGNKILVQFYAGPASFKIINGIAYSSNVSNAAKLGIGAYNPTDGFLYLININGGIDKISINTAGANGDVITPYFVTNSTTSGCTSDGTTPSNFCGLINSQIRIRNGTVYFSDGAGTNGTSNHAIRYFDDDNKLRTVFGSQPFSGHNMNKTLARGMFSGIYYKKSTEPNQAAFPEGLYFVESKGVVFGHIDPVTENVTQLWGNQARTNYSIVTGTSIDKDVNMGTVYNANAKALTFDSDGLPWMRASHDAVSIDANKQMIRHTGGNSVLLSGAPNNADPANYSLYVSGGSQNFTMKGNAGLFMLSSFVSTGNDPLITIRYMDFANHITPIIIGGNYKASDNMAASADIATAGAVATAPLSTNCRNTNACFMSYKPQNDSLYFVEAKNMRYITTASNPATSTLATLFTSPTNIYNFAFTPNGSQLWHFRSDGGLYCKDISSLKSWCDNTTDHFAIRTAAGFSVTFGPNQMTFKDNQTLFVSTYGGEILQFNLPTGN